LGSGTTVFKDVVNLKVSCPKYIHLDEIYDDSFLFFHGYSEPFKLSKFDVVKFNSLSLTGVTTASLTVPYPLYGIKTLSQGNGIFVGIFQDFDDLSNTANVVAGKVSVDGKSIALGNTALYEPEVKDFSVDPRITRLSDNTFALSYFQYIGVSGVYTRFGKLRISRIQANQIEGLFIDGLLHDSAIIWQYITYFLYSRCFRSG